MTKKRLDAIRRLLASYRRKPEEPVPTSEESYRKWKADCAAWTKRWGLHAV